MKPSSPLSSLLFIHLISAAPIPSPSSKYRRFSSCLDLVADNPKPDNPKPDKPTIDPYFPVLYHHSTSDKPMSRITLPVWESIASPKEDSYINTISSSAFSTHNSLVWAIPQKSSKWMASPANDYGRAFLCLEQSKPLSFTREYNELLVLGIVIFFFAVLAAWEAIWRWSGHCDDVPLPPNNKEKVDSKELQRSINILTQYPDSAEDDIKPW